ncbi:MAG: single-stranded DNA-binding protein [Acidobacteriota bacterium]|jgi:single-strand DNA-binding protein|nr:single-stranded DNA-binding protein [Acidobacteriota bacterium]
MSSLNKIMLIGHLGRDPEVRYTPDGAPVATFSLATSENWTDKNGSRQEHTEWHTIVAWNKLADLCKRYLSKGRQVYIEGRIRSREWTDKDGNKRRTTEVIASQMVLLGSRSQGADAGVQPMEPMGRTAAEPDSPFGDAGITDSDIPF